MRKPPSLLWYLASGLVVTAFAAVLFLWAMGA